MRLVILFAFRQALQTVAEAFGTVTDGLTGGSITAGAGAAVRIIVYLLPVIAAIVFSVFFHHKGIKGALAAVLLALYGGLEFLLSSGRVAAAGSALIVLGEVALALGVTLLVCLLVYALFHRKSRRRLPPDDYDEDEEEDEEEQHPYAAFDDYYRR